ARCARRCSTGWGSRRAWIHSRARRGRTPPQRPSRTRHTSPRVSPDESAGAFSIRLDSRALGEGYRAVEEGLADLPSRDGDDPTEPVYDEALRELVGPIGVGEGALGIAQARVGEPEAVDEAQRVG